MNLPEAAGFRAQGVRSGCRPRRGDGSGPPTASELDDQENNADEERRQSDRPRPLCGEPITALAAAHPGFSRGFRQAVATLEIGRLRERQALAWEEMSETASAIRRYMALVPEEMARVAPWTFSSQETVPLPIVAERNGLSVKASGVLSVNVQIADGATFVLKADLNVCQ